MGIGKWKVESGAEVFLGRLPRCFATGVRCTFHDEMCVYQPILRLRSQKNCLHSARKQKIPALRRGFFVKLTCILHGAEAGVDFAEYVADDRSENHESGDHNDGDQNEN